MVGAICWLIGVITGVFVMAMLNASKARDEEAVREQLRFVLQNRRNRLKTAADVDISPENGCDGCPYKGDDERITHIVQEAVRVADMALEVV